MNIRNNYIKLNKIFLIVIVFLFAIVMAKLVFVAVSPTVDGIDLKAFSDSIVEDKKIIRADRGTVYDVNGEALARNVRSYTVIAYLAESRTTDLKNPRHVVDKVGTARALTELLGMSEEYILELLNSPAYQVELGPGGRDISELTRGKIEALDLPGIDFIKGVKRHYPYSTFACYIIGYARKNDDGLMAGEMGIESKYNEELKGYDGWHTYQKDAYGYPIVGTPEVISKATNGNDIYLTIDYNVQMYLENAINNLKANELDWATITVADAKTGAIVGSASSPSFDPNILEIDNYNNPLTSYSYEPGSTMKIFSFMAAMENGIYAGDELYTSGHIMIDGFKISDYNTHGWGKISFDTGFTYSSNIAAVNLGQELGKDKLMDYYEKLGFGTKTGIELPNEYDGTVEIVYKTELASAAFGQGITTTPIQNIQALTAITNNGTTMKPYIIDKIVDHNTGQIIYEGQKTELNKVASAETVQKIMDLMDETVNGADSLVTGKRYHTDVLTLIGKTGTAQYTLADGKYSSGGYNNIKSFAGIFPKDDPQYIIYISVKRYAGSSEALGDVVKSVVESIAKYKNIEDRVSDLDQSMIITTNNYINRSVAAVTSELEASGLKPIVIGNGETIIKQSPARNTATIKGNKIFLLTNGSEIKMPNAIGWNSSEIVSFANLSKLSYNINGYGRVKELSIMPESIIEPGSNLQITLDNRS